MEGDWEMLQKSDTGLAPDLAEKSRDIEGIEGDSEGVIRSDYFALDSQTRYPKKIGEDDREESSVESDNPSWVDPVTESRYGDEAKGELGFRGIELPCKNSGDFWSDSSSDGSVARKFGGFDGKGELGFVEDAKRELNVGGIDVEHKNFDMFGLDSGGDGSIYQKFSCSEEKGELGFGDDAKGEMGFEGIGIKYKMGRADSGSDESICEKSNGVEGEGILGFGDLVKTRDGLEFGGAMEEVEGGDGSVSSVHVEREGDGFSAKTEKAIAIDEVQSGNAEKKRVVWWKLPMELLNFCAFRISPVWSFSIAAAIMGFVILGRRLYKMKHKSQSIQLKLSVDDKKVSQFKSRAARLNEAFSVVKRSPIVRASLPAAGGVTPWPVISLR